MVTKKNLTPTEKLVEELATANQNFATATAEIAEVRRQRGFDRLTRIIHILILCLLVWIGFGNKDTLRIVRSATTPGGQIKQQGQCEGVRLTLQIINDNRKVTANPRYPELRPEDVDVPKNPYC